MLAMCIYYPVLLVASIVLWFKRSRQSKSSHS
jgi:hypothetical protein